MSFDRSWDEYKNGFGDPAGEFWAGNDLLYHFTKRGTTQLRLDMESFGGINSYAVYSNFSIDNEMYKYALYLGDYTGDTGN